MEAFNGDAPVMPVHFAYNLLSKEDSKLPLQNAKYSQNYEEHFKTLEEEDLFTDKPEKAPSHVVVNYTSHLKNSGTGKRVVSVTQRIKNKFVTTVYYRD